MYTDKYYREAHKTKKYGVLSCYYSTDITFEDVMSNYVVYKLTFPDGQIYVGKSEVGLRYRMKEHLSHAERADTVKDLCILKHKKFNCEVMSICENKKDLKNREKACILSEHRLHPNKLLNQVRY